MRALLLASGLLLLAGCMAVPPPEPEAQGLVFLYGCDAGRREALAPSPCPMAIEGGRAVYVQDVLLRSGHEAFVGLQVTNSPQELGLVGAPGGGPGLQYAAAALAFTRDGGATWEESPLPLPLEGLPPRYSYAHPGDLEDDGAGGVLALGQYVPMHVPVGLSGDLDRSQAVVFVARFDPATATWSSATPVGSAHAGTQTYLARLDGGRLLAVWTTHAGMAYATSQDGGASWQAGQPFAPDCFTAQDLVVRGAGAQLLCWDGDFLAAYALPALWSFDGSAWTAGEPLAMFAGDGSAPACRRFALAADASAMAVLGVRCPTLWLATSFDEGRTWTAVLDLANATSVDDGFEAAQWSSEACVADGRLHLLGDGSDRATKPITDREPFQRKEYLLHVDLANRSVAGAHPWLPAARPDDPTARGQGYASHVACAAGHALVLAAGIDQAWVAARKA